MERQAQRRIAANVDFDVPDSNPADTDRLWSIVRGMPSSTAVPTSDAMSSDTDPIQTIPRPHRTPARPHPAPAPARALAPKRQKRRSTKASSSRSSASIDDADFKQTVLIPRGVELLQYPTTTVFQPASTHFGTKDIPESKKKAFYKKKLEERMKIFINGGSRFVKDVVKEYLTFDSWGLIERRWSNLALKYFLKDELMDMYHEKTGHFMAERRDEESIQPHDLTKWDAFPILEEDENTKEFSFAISPDAVYWLSLQAFDTDWERTASMYTHIHEKRAICPYLSIEFKKDPKDTTAMRKALNQMTCSSVLGLYNRWKLRLDAIKARKRPWGKEDNKLVRHYGIIMAGVDFGVWIAEARVGDGGEWLGSRVQRIYYGELKVPKDVRGFTDWVNEIHHWGLKRYCEGIADDIKVLAEKDRLNALDSSE